MSQQCEHPPARLTAPGPAGPSPVLFASGRLTVVVADAARVDWLAALGAPATAPGGGTLSGRRLLPDREQRTGAAAPLVPRNLATRLDVEAFLLALADGRPAGSCWLTWQGDGPWRFLPARAGYLTELVVRSGPLAAATANLLLRTAATHAAGQGRPLLRLSCAATNTELRGTLDAAGFHQLGVQTPPAGRPPQALYERGRP